MQTVNPIEILKATVAIHRTQREAAQQLRISTSMLNDLLRGRRPFSVAMLRKLGLKRIIVRA